MKHAPHITATAQAASIIHRLNIEPVPIIPIKELDSKKSSGYISAAMKTAAFPHIIPRIKSSRSEQPPAFKHLIPDFRRPCRIREQIVPTRKA